MRAFGNAFSGAIGNAYSHPWLETDFDLLDLFSQNQNGLLLLPTPDSSYPQWIESNGITLASADQVVGFVTDRSKKGVLGPQLISNSEFTENINGWAKRPATVGTESWNDGALRWQRHASTTGLSTGVSHSFNLPTVPAHYLYLTRIRKISGNVILISEIRDADGGGGAQIAQNEPTITTETQWTETRGIYYLVNSPRHLTLRLGAGTTGLGEIGEKDYARFYHFPGNHAFQPISANCPLLKNDNGIWYWLFDGVNDNWESPGSATLARNVSGITLVAVTKPDPDLTGTSYSISVSANVAGNARAGMGRVRSGSKIWAGGRRLDSDDFRFSTFGSFDTEKTVDLAEFNYGTATMRVYQNGQLVINDTNFHTAGNTSDTNSAVIQVGRQSALYHKGTMEAVIIIPRILSDSERNRVIKNLAKRSGISI